MDEDYSEKLKLAKRFISESGTRFRTVPLTPDGQTDVVTRSAVFGLFGGVGNYLLVHALPLADTSGNRDEISASLTMLAGALIGSMHKKFVALCSPTEKGRTQNATNIFSGTTGGLALGGAVAALLPVIGLAVVPAYVLAAIVVGGGIAGTGSGALVNRVLKKKRCPYCPSTGKCSQVVCRSCKRLFYPSEVDLNCTGKSEKYIDGFDIVSFLQNTRRLSYLDADVLIKTHFGEWAYETKPEGILVDCKSFMEWVRAHESEVLDFQGQGTDGRDEYEIRNSLDSLDRTVRDYRKKRGKSF